MKQQGIIKEYDILRVIVTLLVVNSMAFVMSLLICGFYCVLNHKCVCSNDSMK